MQGNKTPDFLVGLGGVEEDFETFEHFFARADHTSGGAYIVILAATPTLTNTLTDRLSRQTQMPVKCPVDGEQLQANTIYIPRPGNWVELVEDRFKILSRPQTQDTPHSSTIDLFFRALATEWKTRGCGVILSGKGSDGAEGIRAIEAAGGFTCAQSPESAKFVSMPLAAIATKSVRAVEAPKRMARVIVEAMRLKTFVKLEAETPHSENAPTLTGRPNALHSQELALQPAYSALLGQYAPDSLLLSEERVLLHSFGNARRFLRPPVGIAHLDIAEMVDPALRSPLIVGIEQVWRDKTPISFSKLRLKEHPEIGKLVDLHIQPLFSNEGSKTSSPYALVIIDERPYTEKDAQIPSTKAHEGATFDQEHTEKLEKELLRTREALHATHAELNVVKTELNTVNTEYHSKKDKLKQLNIDFDLLLQSTEIGIIFLDPLSQITKFTALAGSMFNLTAADIGRSISTFRSPFADLNPETMLQSALESESIIEKEAVDSNGVAWLIRAVAHENNQGSLLTVINIGRLRDAEVDIVRKNEMLSVMQDMMKAFYFELTSDLSKITTQIGLQAFLGRNNETAANSIDFDVIHPDDHALLATELQSSRDKANVQFVARMWYAPEQAYRHIQFFAVRSEEGSWNVSGFDVHDHLKTQIELFDRQSILSAVLQASPSLVSYLDQDGRYVYVNHAYLTAWEVTEDEIIGKTVEEFLPPEIYVEAKPHIEAVLKDGERQEYVVERPRDDGETQRTAVVYQPVMNSKKERMGFVTDVLDVSRFYDHAEQVKSLDKVLSLAARKSNYGLFVVDVNTLTLEYANPNALARLGLAKTSILPKGMKITRLTPSWGDKTWTKWLNMNADGGDLTRFDVIVFDSDGENSQADMYAGITEYNGQLKAVIRVFDNKERVRMFQDLQARSRELAMSNRDLEQFASIVAHDLSAPLRHITQFSEMVEEEIGANPTEAAKDYLSIIKHSALKMSDMVGGLLKYSRLGLSTPAFEHLDLKTCLQTAQELLSTDITKSKATLSVTGTATVFGDQDLLTRLFQNLIQNSIKYAKQDVAPIIVIHAQERDFDIQISVQDNGIGIKQEHSHSIFNLFQRLHKDNEYEGLGVGLATCQRITGIHDGTISLDSEYTGGTKFLVTLPKK